MPVNQNTYILVFLFRGYLCAVVSQVSLKKILYKVKNLTAFVFTRFCCCVERRSLWGWNCIFHLPVCWWIFRGIVWAATISLCQLCFRNAVCNLRTSSYQVKVVRINGVKCFFKVNWICMVTHLPMFEVLSHNLLLYNLNATFNMVFVFRVDHFRITVSSFSKRVILSQWNKWNVIHMQIKLIFIRAVVHQALLWQRSLRQLANGEIVYALCAVTQLEICCCIRFETERLTVTKLGNFK